MSGGTESDDSITASSRIKAVAAGGEIEFSVA